MAAAQVGQLLRTVGDPADVHQVQRRDVIRSRTAADGVNLIAKAGAVGKEDRGGEDDQLLALGEGRAGAGGNTDQQRSGETEKMASVRRHEVLAAVAVAMCSRI